MKILITGSNTGIGAACAVQLATLAAEGGSAASTHVILACRSATKAAPVIEAVKATGARASFLELDLADIAQADGAARAFAREHETLDLLVNNGGVGGQRGLTKNGYEMHFGVNHLGHFAFTMPLLRALENARGRIVNVSSGNHLRARSIPWESLRETTKSYAGLPEYGVSKLCNVLFTAELRRRRPLVTSVSMNPGPIASDIWRRMPGPLYAVFKLLRGLETVEVGGARLVHATQVPCSGAEAPLYFHLDQPRAANPLALREDLATELWSYCERAVMNVMASGDVARRPAPPATALSASV